MSVEFEIKQLKRLVAHYIELDAGVRYWEDASVNGSEDTNGTMIPLRKGDKWCPVIRLSDGRVEDWPKGTTADVHYKVCDDGEYWLLDENRKRIAKWSSYFVPNDILCIGDNGYGDYIILTIGNDGIIDGWSQPAINGEEWKCLINEADARRAGATEGHEANS